MNRVNICWLRRDLRLNDHTALYHALRAGLPVVSVFIFDRNILDKLEDHHDRRVQFIYEAITRLWQQLKEMGSTLEVYYGYPHEIFDRLLQHYEIEQVFASHDYEPYAQTRDAHIARQLAAAGVKLHTFKDAVVLEKDEVLKDDGKPYTVFTPYSKKWKAVLQNQGLPVFKTEPLFPNFFRQEPMALPRLEAMGFVKTETVFPPNAVANELLKKYGEQRDIPGINGTSKLGVHLRFGTISIRELVAQAQQQSEKYLGELIWREFYHQILWHFPHVAEGKSFKPAYDRIEWLHNETLFEKWCAGNTGYPIVDAGMRELEATGYMHNRVRMIVASFLTKHLLLDWRLGEAWFARKLLDFELASNNGGWQWAAGCGCDAAPYFRVFNPYLQTLKFDAQLTYIRKWVPEFESLTYPKPVVEHEFARNRCLAVFKKALGTEMPGS